MIALVVCTCIAAAAEWNVIRHQNRDYVTFQNVAEFYHFAEYSQVNRTISLRGEHRGIRAQAGTNEIYINGVRFFTYFPLVENSSGQLISAFDVGKLIEPILRPSRIPNGARVETVVLDPGHGGTDQGTANTWGSEKAFALDVAFRAREELVRAGFKVEMTRSDDTGLSLEERVEFANRFSNAVFVSIHFNSGTGGAGVESYALPPEGVGSTTASSGEHHAAATDNQPDAGNAQDGLNVALAAAVHAAVLSRVSAYDRGVRYARFKVLRNIRIPALLLEAGFLNDPAEGQRIATVQYRQQLAGAIAQGVESYNAAVNYRSDDSTFAVLRSSLPAHGRSIVEPLHPEQPSAAQPAAEGPSVSINAGDR
jgi:N-acetylmuramoyl-L-alanine amidase